MSDAEEPSLSPDQLAELDCRLDRIERDGTAGVAWDVARRLITAKDQSANDYFIRPGRPDDVDYLVWIRVEGQGELPAYMTDWTAADYAKDRRRMLGFLQDPDKFTYIAETPESTRAGAIFGDHLHVNDDNFTAGVLRSLPAEVLPANGLVSDIFELWVEPPHRRRGIATRLKIAAEQSARRFGCGAMYTHTNVANPHVVELNLKLGYREIRRAPIWDEIVRVSLIKSL